jgi:hypothetical protein
MIDSYPILHVTSLVGTYRHFILSAKPLFQDEPITYKIIEYDFPNSSSISKIANDIYHLRLK